MSPKFLRERSHCRLCRALPSMPKTLPPINWHVERDALKQCRDSCCGTCHCYRVNLKEDRYIRRLDRIFLRRSDPREQVASCNGTKRSKPFLEGASLPEEGVFYALISPQSFNASTQLCLPSCGMERLLTKLHPHFLVCFELQHSSCRRARPHTSTFYGSTCV